MNMKITNASSKEDIYAAVVDTLHNMFELEKPALTLDANLFTDLDIDSIDAVDLVVALSELTGKRMQPDTFKAVRTINDVVNALADLFLEKKT